MLKHQRVQDDYDAFRNTVTETLTVPEIVNDVEIAKELYFVHKFYDEIMLSIEYDDSMGIGEFENRLDFVEDFEDNMYKSLYEFYEDNSDDTPDFFPDFSEVVEAWIQYNRLYLS